MYASESYNRERSELHYVACQHERVLDAPHTAIYRILIAFNADSKSAIAALYDSWDTAFAVW